MTALPSFRPPPLPPGFIRWLTLLLVSLALPASCQYALDSVIVTAGGHVSTGGDFQLVAAVGTPVGGSTSAGDGFALEAMATTFVTVQQTVDAPALTITLISPKELVLSWPVSAKGFQLQYCTDLRSGDWQSEPAPVIDTPTSHTVKVPNKGVRCYRLKQ